MASARTAIYVLSFLLAASGFLLPFWPLCALAILGAALSGRWIFALLIALLIDIAWGAPTGSLARYAHVPFTLLALAAALVRRLTGGYFLDRTPRDTL